MRYEWDERKNLQNQREHDGVSFELAALVFEDERCLIEVDRIDEAGEQRWHAIGAALVESGIEDFLLVVHVYRHPGDKDLSPRNRMEDDDGERIIRIISARRASKNDFRRYQEQEMD